MKHPQKRMQSKPCSDWKVAKFVRLIGAIRNWPRTLVDHLRLTSTDYVCHTREGLSFHVRGGTDDRHIVYEVFVNHIYPIQLSAESWVIDVGAHIGCFSLLASKTAAQVLSFEPFYTSFAVLERNVRLNKANNIQLFQMAVSGSEGYRNLHCSENIAETGRYSLHRAYQGQRIEVPSITLEGILTGHNLVGIELLKLDCQGSEYEILYTASRETLARIKEIIVECEHFDDPSDWSPAAMASYLKDLGFTIRTEGNMIYASRE